MSKHKPEAGGYYVVYQDGYKSFSPAGAFESGYSLNSASKGPIMEAARVAHEVNRAYCQSIGDHSQLPWSEAPQWAKDSAVAGVNFHMANSDAGPEASHESWSDQKLEDGWQYGPVKDAEKKTHPCLVPFTELPAEQQAKDYLFRAVVHSMMGLSE